MNHPPGLQKPSPQISTRFSLHFPSLNLSRPNGDFKKPEKSKNSNTVNSGLISVFGGDDDDEPSQKSEKKKSPQK